MAIISVNEAFFMLILLIVGEDHSAQPDLGKNRNLQVNKFTSLPHIIDAMPN